MAVVNAPLAEIKDDDPPLLRLKKQRFNAALKEAKARFDLYNRGLTRIPELFDVGERLFGAARRSRSPRRSRSYWKRGGDNPGCRTPRRLEIAIRIRSATHPSRLQSNGGFPKAIKAITMKPMKFMTTLERDEDAVWFAECPSIPGCVSQGKSREEALDNIREAIVACLEVRAERGMPLTIETLQVEVTV
jgi:predicted RNase H-like HicB family nuclease